MNASIACPIFTAAARDPHGLAYREGECDVTFKEMDKLVEHQSALLTDLRGKRAGFQPQNTLDDIVLFWALFRCQAVACPISTRYSSNQAQGLAEQVAGEWLPSLDLRRRLPVPIVQTALRPDQIATIIFSSGTTNSPKAVVHDLRAHLLNAEGSNVKIPLEPSDRWLLSLPIYHVGGLAILFRSAVAGSSVVIPTPGESLVDSILNSGITHLSVVTTQLRRVLQSLASGMTIGTHLKAVLLGGSAFPKELVAAACRAELPLYLTYGLTEMASQVATTQGCPNETLNVGRALKHRELAIGEDGEILTSGPTLCRGYWQTNQIVSVTDKDGWFHTGDVGSIDANGRLTVTGRIDNMFISGGENIHPEEIENCLLGMEVVRQAIVVPVKNTEYGQRPVAVVETDNLDVHLIRDRLSERLPPFKLPEAIYPWPESLDQTGVKPSRRSIAEYVARLRSMES